MTEDAVQAADPGFQAAEPARLHRATRPLYWSLRRELWEHRFVTVVPPAVGGLLFCGFLIGATVLPAPVKLLPRLESASSSVITAPYSIVAMLLFLTTFLVGAFYCADALHGERRDRSILFWKSLPVSDLTAVLAKASVPLLALPAIAAAVVVTTQLAILVSSCVILLLRGSALTPLFASLHLPTMTLILLYGMAVQTLWFAPVYAWLLLVSAWARRAPLLWALLPPLAISALEQFVLGTSHLASLLLYRLTGATAHGFIARPKGSGPTIDALDQLTPITFLTTPGLYVGLAVAAACIAMATQRRGRFLTS